MPRSTKVSVSCALHSRQTGAVMKPPYPRLVHLDAIKLPACSVGRCADVKKLSSWHGQAVVICPTGFKHRPSGDTECPSGRPRSPWVGVLVKSVGDEDQRARSTTAIAMAYSSQCDSETEMTPTPARVADSRTLPESRAVANPCRGCEISMLRQGMGPSHRIGSALKTASLAANRAAK